MQAEDLRARAWVSQAAELRAMGRREEADALLERAAEVEPKVRELYLREDGQ